MPVRTAQDWYREGNRRFEARDFEAALSSYTEAIRLNPEYAAAYSYRGGVRRIKGNLGGALEDYNEAIRLKPHLADTYYHRGVLREEMADYRAAAEDLQRYLDLGGALVGVERAEVEARIRRLRQR